MNTVSEATAPIAASERDHRGAGIFIGTATALTAVAAVIAGRAATSALSEMRALGGADVGVAIGAELNEVALGGADVALLGTDRRRLPQLIGLADITRDVIGQNVWLAFDVSLVLIALAARGTLNPLTGALAQSIAVFVVVANSARILRFAAPDRPSPRERNLESGHIASRSHVPGVTPV
jgi:hypothetical protein